MAVPNSVARKNKASKEELAAVRKHLLQKRAERDTTNSPKEELSNPRRKAISKRLLAEKSGAQIGDSGSPDSGDGGGDSGGGDGGGGQ